MDIHDEPPINPYESPQPAEAVDQGVGAPISFLEVTSTGLQLYRRNLLSIIIVSMTVWIPLEFTESYVEYFVLNPEDFGRAFQMRSLLEGLFGIIAQAGVISIGLGDLRGERVSWLSALRQGIGAWPRMLWSGIVCQFCVMIGLLLLVIPGLYLATRMSLYQCVAVNEGRSGPACLNRSMTLTKGSFIGFFILGTFSMVAFLVIAVIVQLPLIFYPEGDNWIIYAISNLFVELVAPVFTLMYVSAYWGKAQSDGGGIPTWTTSPRTNKVVVSTSPRRSTWWES